MLGRFEVSAGSRLIREEEWRLRKAASFVKVLALSRDHRLHREQAMEMLWPDLTLVARGLTNRRIARELSISERTVATHVKILKKLGFQSRSQVAARVAEQSSPARRADNPGPQIPRRRAERTSLLEKYAALRTHRMRRLSGG